MLERISKLNPWVFAIVLAIGVHLLIVLLAELTSGFQWYNTLIYIFASPSFNIVAHDVVYHINEFNGDPISTENFSNIALLSGLGVFVIFIVGPILLVKGYKQADKSDNKKQRSWTWNTGAILIFTSMVPVFISSTVGTKVYMNTNESIAESRDKDELRSALMNLALDASYMLFLPQEIGGGGGSFNSVGEESRSIQLSDLDSYDSNSPYDFIIHEKITDSTITIIGVSEFKGKAENFKNLNGETGKRQLSVVVSPFKKNIFSMPHNELAN